MGPGLAMVVEQAEEVVQKAVGEVAVVVAAAKLAKVEVVAVVVV